MASNSDWILALFFSTWDSLALSWSAVDSASDRRACIFNLAISSSSALATPSFSYLSFIIGLGHLSDAVLLGRDLFIVVISHASNIMFSISVFTQQRLSLLGLVVSHSTGLGQLVS